MMYLKHEFLCDMTIDIASQHPIASTPSGRRLVAQFAGGHFSGPRLNGKVLPAGADSMIIRADGVMVISVQPYWRPTLAA